VHVASFLSLQDRSRNLIQRILTGLRVLFAARIFSSLDAL
jgi:hypothetical protein